MAEGDLIHVEVAYALPDEQVLLSVNVLEGTTLEQAIRQSGVLDKYPEIDLSSNSVGIFGRVTSAEQVLEEGDRVEIYRPLIADPKVVRRERAALKAEAQKAAAARAQKKRNRGASGAELEG